MNVCVFLFAFVYKVYLNKELVACVHKCGVCNGENQKEEVVLQIMCFSFAFLIKNFVSVFYVLCLFWLPSWSVNGYIKVVCDSKQKL